MFSPIPSSYKILNPAAVDKESDLKKAAQLILDATGLDAETYRLGHTKACVPVHFFMYQTNNSRQTLGFFQSFQDTRNSMPKIFDTWALPAAASEKLTFHARHLVFKLFFTMHLDFVCLISLFALKQIQNSER